MPLTNNVVVDQAVALDLRRPAARRRARGGPQAQAHQRGDRPHRRACPGGGGAHPRACPGAGRVPDRGARADPCRGAAQPRRSSTRASARPTRSGAGPTSTRRASWSARGRVRQGPAEHQARPRPARRARRRAATVTTVEEPVPEAEPAAVRMLSYNVAGLLRAAPGTVRRYPVDAGTLDIADDLRLAAPIDGEVRLSRTGRSILARAELETALEEHVQPLPGDPSSPGRGRGRRGGAALDRHRHRAAGRPSARARGAAPRRPS